MSIILRFFPNGEFLQGVSVPKRRDAEAKRRHEITAEMIPVGASASLRLNGRHLCVNAEMISALPGDEFVTPSGHKYTYIAEHLGVHTYGYESNTGFVSITTLYDRLHRCINRGELVYIGSSIEPILKEPTVSRKKCLSMTSSMARNIRNASYLMEQDYGKDCLSFATLTVPGISSDALKLVCFNWDSILHRFFMWFKQFLCRKHIEPCFVYCTEIQTKRLKLRHEFAPHLHILFRGRLGKKKSWAVTPKDLRKAWVRCLKSCIDESFDERAVENLQRIKKSASGYLSKYMSKGANSLPGEASPDTSITFLRTHWGGMSRILSRRVAQCITTLKDFGEGQNYASLFLSAIPALLERGLVAFWRERLVVLSVNSASGQEWGIKVGYGRLSSATYTGGLVSVLEFCLARMHERLF